MERALEPSLTVGRLFGIRISLSANLAIVFVLVMWTLAAGYFPAQRASSTDAVLWALSILGSLCFFGSVLIHELAHSVVALRHGIPVSRITLFIFGGVAQIGREASTPRMEAEIAIAGPAASFVLTVLFASVFLITAGPLWPVATLCLWLAIVNGSLAVFNMIPGFPLDGGRVLRSIIWGVTGDAEGSTRIAARVGQVVAGAFILYGLFSFVTGAGFGGLWIALIGWFLLEAASASYAHVEVTRGLRGVRAADLMSTDCIRVDAGENLRDFVEERLLRSGRRCFLVERDGRLAGLVTIAELKQVNRSDWDRLRVEDAMRPLAELRTIGPDTPASETLEIMSRNDVNQLPVVSNGRIDGIVSRGNILHYLRNRAELEV